MLYLNIYTNDIKHQKCVFENILWHASGGKCVQSNSSKKFYSYFNAVLRYWQYGGACLRRLDSGACFLLSVCISMLRTFLSRYNILLSSYWLCRKLTNIIASYLATTIVRVDYILDSLFSCSYIKLKQHLSASIVIPSLEFSSNLSRSCISPSATYINPPETVTNDCSNKSNRKLVRSPLSLSKLR